MPDVIPSSPPQPKAKLRVGLLLDGAVQPNWITRLVQNVSACPLVDSVALIVEKAPARSVSRRRPFDRNLLFRLYMRLDERLFGASDDALAPRSLAGVLVDDAHVRVLRSCGVEPGPIASADLDGVRSLGLDVLLDLTSDSLNGSAQDLAKHGVWRFQHGTSGRTPAALGGFWEVVENRYVTESALVRVHAPDGRLETLYRSYAPTDSRSVRRNGSRYLWKTSDFFVRKLRDLYEAGDLTPAPSSFTGDDDSDLDKHAEPPTNIEMARLSLGLVGRHVRGKLERLLFADQWFVAYSVGGMREQCLQRSARMFTYLLPPEDRYWADPFPVTYGNEKYIFFEDFDRKRRRAHLAVVRVDENGRAGTPIKVLERPYHLSYPFVFQWQGEFYMLPETRGNRSVELYRAVDFPTRWELVGAVMRDINAADATMAEIDGRWWLFVNVGVEGAGNADELHLFYAETPLGPWTPHARNPIKSDARSARPAGRILQHGGDYFRPAQDCSGWYGRALVLNRIVHLDPHNYVEEEVGRIEADPSGRLLGTHTFNVAGDLVCLDGVMRSFRLGGRLRSPRLGHGWAVLRALDEPGTDRASISGCEFQASGVPADLLGRATLSTT